MKWKVPSNQAVLFSKSISGRPSRKHIIPDIPDTPDPEEVDDPTADENTLGTKGHRPHVPKNLNESPAKT